MLSSSMQSRAGLHPPNIREREERPQPASYRNTGAFMREGSLEYDDFNDIGFDIGAVRRVLAHPKLRPTCPCPPFLDKSSYIPPGPYSTLGAMARVDSVKYDNFHDISFNAGAVQRILARKEIRLAGPTPIFATKMHVCYQVHTTPLAQ